MGTLTNFQIALLWETLPEPERTPLRTLITTIVGYPCKIACVPNNESVDIIVFSEKKRKETDWIEIQPTGAIGAIYDLYEKYGVSDEAAQRIDDICDEYNEENEVEFQEDSEGDSEEEDEEGEGGEGEGEDRDGGEGEDAEKRP